MRLAGPGAPAEGTPINDTENSELKRKLLLIGGGGHCRSVLDTAMQLNRYDEIGIVDFTDSSCLGVPVVGNDDDIPDLIRQGWNEAFITVGSVGSTRVRRRLYEMVKKLNLKVPSLIDPTAVIAGGAEIGEGTFVGKRAVVNTCAAIGKCAIINTGAIVEHDCRIGDFSHISPGAVVCGQVTVGNDSHVGAGTVVRQQIVIGDNVLIGAGSTVVKDIPAGTKAYGNPCKVVEK